VKRRSVALASVFVLALAGAAIAVARPSVAHVTTVKVAAKDFSFVLSPKTVHHGRVTFVIKNEGATAHDFAIAGHTSKMVHPGKTVTLTVTLKKGRIPYRCTVDSHARLGMKGVLRVT
jgi:uncharacterized cupredoxin-like copper-binding protein